MEAEVLLVTLALLASIVLKALPIITSILAHKVHIAFVETPWSNVPSDHTELKHMEGPYLTASCVHKGSNATRVKKTEELRVLKLTTVVSVPHNCVLLELMEHTERAKYLQISASHAHLVTIVL